MASPLVRLDHYLTPVAVRVSGAMQHLRRDTRVVHRPLIVRPGGLGDLIVATAALESLGRPATSVDWIVERRSEVWARHLGLPYSCYDGPARDLIAFLGLRRLCINLEQRYGLSAAFARAAVHRDGRLFGFDTNRGRRVYTDIVEYDPDGTPELHCFAALLGAALTVPVPPFRPRQRATAAQDHYVVAIAGTAHPTRAFDVGAWMAMIQRFVPDGRVIIIAAPADEPLARGIAVRAPAVAECLIGDFSRICETIATARRVFSIDGGMVHVASYYGVPVDTVFTAGRDSKWQAWSSGSTVIKHPELPCQPCTMFGQVPPCRHAFRCKEMTRWSRRPQ